MKFGAYDSAIRKFSDGCPYHGKGAVDGLGATANRSTDNSTDKGFEIKSRLSSGLLLYERDGNGEDELPWARHF